MRRSAWWVVATVLVLAIALWYLACGVRPSPVREPAALRAAFCKDLGYENRGKIAADDLIRKRSPFVDDPLVDQPDFRCYKITGNWPSRAKLQSVRLDGAVIEARNLDGADLRGARLRYADLTLVSMINANLAAAKLDHAVLAGTILNEANLENASLTYALLFDTRLEKTNLRRANLHRAIFQPDNLPPISFIASAKELESLDINWRRNENPSALQKLRKDFLEGGLRDQERDVTHALMVIEDERLRRKCIDDGLGLACVGAKLVLATRWLLLDLPSDYGRAPFRPFFLVFVLWFVGTFVYLGAIWRPKEELPSDLVRNAIYKVSTRHVGTWINADAPTNLQQPLRYSGGRQLLAALCRAAQFSLIVSVTFGVRDLNLGQWIERMQPTPYDLIPSGWPRLVSGIHAVLCLYLLALWAIVYFGHPFQ